MDNWNNGRKPEVKRNHALVFRCSDEAYERLVQRMKDEGDVYLIYSKSSFLKLFVREEGF